ncbi:MAG: hypothetical protein ISR22_06600 [Candidatus Poseidoniaceae archaeon]|nr:hypothetical protein [Candidatus Poseidoniaceae archaeon]|tara:strand:+ start:329 stop:502 length:174 start_codon:yes stop_codon:yes gene_type:complete
MTIKNTMIDALCWTPLASIIRYSRKRIINKTTSENYDVRRIRELLNKIMTAHGDMLS